MTDQLTYRPCVGIVVINASKHIWIGRRKDRPHLQAWQMPQGGIDEGETPKDAARRELFEETSIETIVFLSHMNELLSYDFPLDLPIDPWRKTHKGQRQQWFLCEFLGPDTQINLHTSHQEFIDWKWEKPEHVLRLAATFKKEIYEKVLKSFNLL